jgi:hypothetical protein
MEFVDDAETRDGSRWVWCAKGLFPPLKVFLGIDGGCAREEGTVFENSQHGLKAGEVSVP